MESTHACMATRADIGTSVRTKIVFGRGAAPDPAGGAHDALPNPLIGWGGNTSSLYPLPYTLPTSALSAPRSSDHNGTFFFPLRALASLGWCAANIRINFTSPETRIIVVSDAENRTIASSFVWTRHRDNNNNNNNNQDNVYGAVIIT